MRRLLSDGTLLASGGQDNTARLWRVSDGELLHTLIGHIDYVFSVVFTLDGATIFTASRDGTIKYWRVDDGELVNTLSGHQPGVLCVAVSPDDRRITFGRMDATLVTVRNPFVMQQAFPVEP
ncbi:MAG: hypothetical protein BroJett003_07470 [Planctomycetota bacterium]|nr:MAG: hypothetical protein BroJett003_07470 [Planctomycetota bacterium]